MKIYTDYEKDLIADEIVKMSETEGIKAIQTATMVIFPSEGQYICKSARGKSYEIWQETPLMLVKRIPTKRVFWIMQ